MFQEGCKFTDAHSASVVCSPSRYVLLTGSPQDPIRDHQVISPVQPANLAIRKGKWMYVSGQGGGFGGTEVGDHDFGGPAAFLFTGQQNSDIENGRIKEGAPPAQLYNLEADPTQKGNLYNEHPEVVEQLQELLKTVLESGESVPDANR